MPQNDHQLARAMARAEAAWLEPPEYPDVDTHGRTDCNGRRCGRCDICDEARDRHEDEMIDRARDGDW